MVFVSNDAQEMMINGKQIQRQLSIEASAKAPVRTAALVWTPPSRARRVPSCPKPQEQLDLDKYPQLWPIYVAPSF